MTPTRPYFLRAIYDWIVDNECTPYLAVYADAEGVEVPREYVENGEITLNISPGAVANFHMDNDYVLFNARFNGISQSVAVPIAAVLGVFAKENGQGMAFPEEPGYEQGILQDGIEIHEDADSASSNVGTPGLVTVSSGDKKPDDDPKPPTTPSSPKGRPQLKVVK
ncbi:MAG: ClpXP protease specificity-enhancing factor [Pseudomonadales bacterium]|nr:ClpXP protease specificity-enhancing factor [Pseudomonadales bacterium]